jgi:hypothetical protein
VFGAKSCRLRSPEVCFESYPERFSRYKKSHLLGKFMTRTVLHGAEPCATRSPNR